MIAARAYLSDSQHEFSNSLIPPAYQGAEAVDHILTIQRGAWIGHAATVLGNITIGYGSVVGANSVVTFDIPSHCVVAGNPASVLKLYDYSESKWVRPQTDEELLQVLTTRGTFDGYDDKHILEAIKSQAQRES
nr:acyltransferase [Paenibacillus phyllosphaerae]